MIKKIATYILVIFHFSCFNEKEISDDAKFVFNQAEFIEFSPETITAIDKTFEIISDNIEAMPILQEHQFIRFSKSDSTLKLLPLEARLRLYENLDQIDTTILKYFTLLNTGAKWTPRFDIRFKDISTKGNRYFHYVSHSLKSKIELAPKYKLDNIKSSLIKYDTLSENLFYQISVSPDIGI